MKGQKTGGRQKGTPNKITRSTREIISRLTDELSADILINLDQLSIEQKANLLPKLLSYSIPKYQPETAPVDFAEALALMQGYGFQSKPE